MFSLLLTNSFVNNIPCFTLHKPLIRTISVIFHDVRKNPNLGLLGESVISANRSALPSCAIDRLVINLDRHCGRRACGQYQTQNAD